MPKRAGVAYPKKSVFSKQEEGTNTPSVRAEPKQGGEVVAPNMRTATEVGLLNVGSAILPRIDDFIGISMGLKFQVYNYEPVDLNVYYGSAIQKGETPESAGERIAQVVSAELDKRTKSLVADFNRLRAEAFDALAEPEG